MQAASTGKSSKKIKPRNSLIIAVGVILFTVLTLSMGASEIKDTQRLMTNTIDTLKNQCMSFDKLITADKIKSLFRLSDILMELNQHIEHDASLASDSYLEGYVDNLRLDGVAILDENLELCASGYTRKFRGTEWLGVISQDLMRSILENPKKIFLERIFADGDYYDVCALGRQDKAGVIIGFYRQELVTVNTHTSDLADLINGLHLEHSGTYIVVNEGTIIASSESQLRGLSASKATMELLDNLPYRESLNLLAYNGRIYFATRTICDDYKIYVCFPLLSAFNGTLTAAIVFIALYIAFWLLLFAIRNRSLRDSKQKLQETNDRLQENINILHSLEEIYFTILYVDTRHGTYESVYLAPWLSPNVPVRGEYNDLKSYLVTNLILPEYKKTIDSRMELSAIRDSLSRDKLTDVRRSFYIDYQATRGEYVNWCRVTVTVVDFDDAGHPAHVLAMLQDVNDEKAKEAQYQAKILAEAQTAKLANIAKTDFLRRISHDIRTPINGIQGYINMSARYPCDMNVQASCREKAGIALTSLMELVNNVLDMSKLEGSDIQLDNKPFDIEQILHDVDVVIKPQATEHNISYIVEHENLGESAHLIGSPLHIRRVLLNLASNSVKYGRSGGYIRIGCRVLKVEGDVSTFEFTCADDGIGMDVEFQKHVFEPFMQESEDARTRYSGSGLGLAIVKKLVDAMNGTITYVSEKGVGTTFTVTLPLTIDRTYRAPVVPVRKSSAPHLLTGLNVLLVEDNELNMEISEFLLTEMNVNVTKAWNGREAVDIFSASDTGYFDIILMDIMMPVMNGIDASIAIRALHRPDAKTVKIIALSANAFTDDVRRSISAGINEHIAKPIDTQQLFSVLEKYTAGNPHLRNS